MTISSADIKKLREQTGAGIVACKNALVEAKGNFEKAIDIIRKKGAATALKKADRAVKEGIVGSYIHSNKRIGVLVELSCETDFVARNETFQKLASDIALHIAASAPRYISADQIPDAEIEKEKDIYREQVAKEGKPANIVEKILEGKLRKYKEEISLMSQPYVRDQEKTVKDIIDAAIGQLGENVQVTGFSRFEIAGSATTCSVA